MTELDQRHRDYLKRKQKQLGFTDKQMIDWILEKKDLKKNES